LQKQLKDLVKGSFEFRNTGNGTRVVTKEMAPWNDFLDDEDCTIRAVTVVQQIITAIILCQKKLKYRLSPLIVP
jgi:hypothetical protein